MQSHNNGEKFDPENELFYVYWRVGNPRLQYAKRDTMK